MTVIAAECASEGLFPVEAVEESAPKGNGPENDAETCAPVDPGYSLDVAEGERVFTRPGFADGGSYEGRAAVLRGVVTVADARAAVERFPAAVRMVGGAVVDGAIVPMGCAMLSARATVRTDAGYVVTLPDGTTVTGTWVECGNAFAEWAITQRPEFVCAMAEGHADGAATLARIGAEVRAERERAEAEAAQAAADLATVAADLERVWSVWSPYVADLTDEDEERVYGVDAGARTALRYARAAVERNDSGAVVHYVNEAREGVEWLAESARRSGLTVPDAPAEVPASVAAPVRALPDVDSAPDAIEAWEGEGGAVPGVTTPPPVYAAETAPEPASPTGFDADASNGDRSPGGEGGFSRELDAHAPKRPVAAVAVMPIDWAKPARRGDCAAANTCGGFGALLWDVPGCAPRCAECAARVMGHSPAALRALTLPGDVVEAEEGAETADIVIRHTHEDGTTVEGSSKGDGVWEALRPLGWTYRRTPGIFIRGSRYKVADRWKINRAADAVRALGLSCAVVIEERMSFAEREAARVDAAEQRVERFADRAGRAAAASQSARDASDRIGERFWMGQPILVGHHSERRARRDQERMHNAMRKSIAEGERAGYWASRAAAADAYERYRKNPGRTLRRIEKLEAERRGVLRERDGVDDKGRKADVWRREPSEVRREELTRRLAEYDEELTYWAETIKEAERRGFKVWGRADFVKGDFVWWRESWYEVTRVNAKTVTVPHILAAFDGGAVGAVGGCRVVTRAATAETRHKGSTYTLPYNEVSGRMSAEQMRAALAGEAIPADPRDVAPEPAPEAAEAERAAEHQDQAAPAPIAPAETVSAPAPAGVSDPGTAEAWEGDGGAVPGVAAPRVVAQFRELDAHAPTERVGRCPARQCREVRGGRCDGCGWTPAPAPVAADEDQESEEEAAAPLGTVAGHPAVAERQTAAEVLTAYAEEHPDDEQAELWAFEAVERVDLCGWAVEEGDEDCVALVVPSAPQPPAVVAPVGAPLSRRPHARGVGGVRAGHSTRQGAARQGARQGTRQASGRVGRSLPRCRERGPPPGIRPAGRVDAPPGLTGSRQYSRSACPREPSPSGGVLASRCATVPP
ncbi:DUF3560 domain-containing protein [Streptomyces sp. NPDC090442]|uniref:DUF3560 domain-containing protein n=1 Tax=Streptomyces sp. NPDC090442 TaxID=3365962 RepID=UPI0038150A83